MEALGRRYSSYSFSTSTLDGVSGQHHAPAALYDGERTPGTHWTGGWVGLRAGLDTGARGNILSPLPGIEPRSPGRPARSQALYWLSYPGSWGVNRGPKIIILSVLRIQLEPKAQHLLKMVTGTDCDRLSNAAFYCAVDSLLWETQSFLESRRKITRCVENWGFARCFFLVSSIRLECQPVRLLSAVQIYRQVRADSRLVVVSDWRRHHHHHHQWLYSPCKDLSRLTREVS
jgi:hypothetical protein